MARRDPPLLSDMRVSAPGEAGTEISMLNVPEGTVSFGGHPEPSALPFHFYLL